MSLRLFDIHVGDVIEGLRRVPDGTVRCCSTSPPYWSLRDYGVDGQIGLEQTPAEYVARLVEVFREVRRVLTLDGTAWLNLGDSYAASCSTRGDRDPKARRRGPRPKRAMPSGDLKPKDLVGIPWRVAFALQDDGWYLRSDIIWAKSACMPESVSDRPTRCHEYIFLLSKSPRYFFDMDAVRERGSLPAGTRAAKGSSERRKHANARPEEYATYDGMRNMRTVWNINPKPFAGAHFAVQPPAIPRRAILAGTSERGQCPDCHAPWVRVVERIGGPPQRITTGWEPTCEHGVEPVPDVVLDPFTGSGTTGMVAVKLGRDFVGCELNPGYAAMASERIGQAAVESGVGGGDVSVDDDPRRAQFTLF